MSARRPIVAYVRRDDIAWWAGCRYADQGLFETYIRETSCLSRWGAKWKAKRMAAAARRLRDRGLADFQTDIGGDA